MTVNPQIEVLDLDTLLPGKKIVKLHGREFDVTELPLGLAMKIIRLKGEMGDETAAAQKIDVIVSVVADVLKASNSEVNEEWVLANLSVTKMTALINFIVRDIAGTMEEEGEEGKAVSDPSASS